MDGIGSGDGCVRCHLAGQAFRDRQIPSNSDLNQAILQENAVSEWFPMLQKIPQTPLLDLLRLHVSGRLNWRARVAESELPQVAKQKIVAVVKATRLWRLEKSQIATELISHFQDGQQRGQDIDKLVSEFGETDTVAKLMQLAKKRNRSLFWKTFVVGCYSFLVFLVFYAGLAVWFFSGKPNPSIDYYEVVSSNAAAVPEGQRAWPIYRDAWIDHGFADLNIGKIVGQEEGDDAWDTWRPGDEKWPNLVQFLEQKESLVKAFRRGGQLPSFGLEMKHISDYSKEDMLGLYGTETFKRYGADAIDEELPGAIPKLLDGALIGVLLNHVQLMRKMTRILQADLDRVVETEDTVAAQEDIVAMLGFAPQAGETPFLVCSLVGLALDGIAYSTIEELLTEHPDLLDDQQLAEIARKVGQLSPRDYVSLEGERASQLDLIQRLYSDDGEGDGRLTHEGLAMLPRIMSFTGTDGSVDSRFSTLMGVVGPGVAFVSGSRKQAEQAMNGVMDEFESTFGKPVYETNIKDRYFEDMLQKYASNDIGTRTLMQMLLPAVEQVRVATERVQGYRNGVLAGIAVHRYRLANGSFPETINQLVPEFLESVPVDVITGDPLKYQLTDGEPVIYSVGADLDDDGGVEAVDSDGKEVTDVNQHFYPANTNKLDGDWVLWPSN